MSNRTMMLGRSWRTLIRFLSTSKFVFFNFKIFLQENIQLKSLLGETQTNIAVLRSDMTQLKTNYETKVTELTK